MKHMLHVTEEDAVILGFRTQKAAQNALRQYLLQYKYPCKRCKERFTSIATLDLHLAIGCGNV